MNELDFLKQDENILDVEITEVLIKNKIHSAVKLTVGLSEDKYTEEMMSNKTIPSQYEIILTSKDINKIKSILKQY